MKATKKDDEGDNWTVFLLASAWNIADIRFVSSRNKSLYMLFSLLCILRLNLLVETKWVLNNFHSYTHLF